MAYKEFGATIAPSNVSDTGFPIAMGTHIGGGRIVNGKSTLNSKHWCLLGEGATLNDQKANAIGQIWYDTSDSKYWKLGSWSGADPVWVDVSTIFATTSYVDTAINDFTLTSSSITSALGYTPYNSTNPNGYTSNAGTVTNVTLNATSPILIDNSAAITTSGTRTFSHATTSGNKHIPSGGSANQILKWSADGTAVWGNDVNTHYTSKNIVSSSAIGILNASATNPYLNHIEESTVTSSHMISGSGATTVSSNATGNITISSTDTNTTYSFTTGTTNGTFNVTPLGGSATAISIYGLGSAAYTASTSYASSSHNHSVFTTTENGFVPKSVTSNTTDFLRRDGSWASPSGTTYTLPLAASGTRGGIQIGYTATGANLPLLLSSEKGYVTLTSSSITTALGYTPNTGTVTNVATGNGLSGGPITTTGTINLAAAYGDTVNPYASKTAKYVLAAPNASNGLPSFRALDKTDIPILNQNTTGSAGSVISSITFNNGGTGAASGITYNGSTAQTISYNTIGASPSNHNHDYTTLLNLPDIYHAYHNTAPNDFDSLYDEPNDVWLCSSSMYNGPSDYSGGTDTGYNNDFSSCVVQQFGEDSGMKIQVLYITTENVNNLNMGYIFYRIRGEDWQRIATYSDVANLQAQIDNLVNNLNNKQDKLSILADISLSANAYTTIYPAANKVQYINLMGSTGTNTIYLNSNYFNSLDEFTIIIHNPNSVGIAINLHSSYKFVGVQPSWSYNSWIICIWRGMIFANILN